MMAANHEKVTAYSYTRFSSAGQAYGDSLRRQMEDAEKYAAKHGLVLDSSLKDLGVSAYSGKNRKIGALASFLTAVREGRVPSGSVLLIEAIDRLSRDKITNAFRVISDITDGGITIITTEDSKLYSSASINDEPGLIWSLIGKIAQANQESKRKSDLVGAAWRTMKKNAVEHGIPFTKTCPGWLRLAADRKSFEKIPERVAIVQRIFAETILGFGQEKIIARLNAEKIPTFSKEGQGLVSSEDGKGIRVSKTGWHASYIAKILENRAVLGEYQPHYKNTETAGRQVSYGEPTMLYEPIIDAATFQKANEARKSRQNTGGPKGGKSHTAINNLLSGMVRCFECSGKAAFRDRGIRRPKAIKPRSDRSQIDRRFVCERHRKNAGCDAAGSVNYEPLETHIMDTFYYLHSKNVLSAVPQSTDHLVIENEIAELRDTIARDERQLGELIANFGNMTGALKTAIETRAASIDAQKVMLGDAQQRLARLKPAVSKDDHLQIVAELKEKVATGDYAARLQVQTALRSIINEITCDFEISSATVFAYNGLIKFTINSQGKIVDGLHLSIPGANQIIYPDRGVKKVGEEGWMFDKQSRTEGLKQWSDNSVIAEVDK